jgi:hypothetical protein
LEQDYPYLQQAVVAAALLFLAMLAQQRAVLGAAAVRKVGLMEPPELADKDLLAEMAELLRDMVVAAAVLVLLALLDKVQHLPPAQAALVLI